MILVDLFLLRPTPYRHACESPRAAWLVAAFLVATGVTYGVLVAAFQRAMGGEIQGILVQDIPTSILIGGTVVSGLLVVVAVHAGITLVTWLMAKAIGGPGLVIGLYRSTAYLLPFGMLALPQVAVNAAAAGRSVPPLPLDWAYVPLAAVGLALFLAGLFHVYVLTQGRGPKRAGIAVVLFALFSASVLLIFSS